MSSDLLAANQDKAPKRVPLREWVKKAGAPAHLSPLIIRLAAARYQTGADKPITAAISAAGRHPSRRDERLARRLQNLPATSRQPPQPRGAGAQKNTHTHTSATKIIEFGSIGAREGIDMHEVRYGAAGGPNINQAAQLREVIVGAETHLNEQRCLLADVVDELQLGQRLQGRRGGGGGGVRGLKQQSG